MNANPPGYGKVLKRDSLRPAYPLSPLAGCPNFRIPTAYYSVISAKLSTLSARSNFGDPDVLEATQIAKKVGSERLRVVQFTRFQKTIDGTYFAALEPIYNVLPLVIGHFQNRFADQCWLLYDIKREYGYYYNRQKVDEVRFETKGTHLLTGKLDQQLMAEDEQLFQQLWRTYFKTIAIKERINPKLHRQNLPVRFWKYLTEK